ncbi:hypothetical protein [uncultured Metabacillus sp.]|nr:hypothetical protein [uncultured Metabacillus sp.]
MAKEKKLDLKDFIKGERFELNSYLNYLVNQVSATVGEESKEKTV